MISHSEKCNSVNFHILITRILNVIIRINKLSVPQVPETLSREYRSGAQSQRHGGGLEEIQHVTEAE